MKIHLAIAGLAEPLTFDVPAEAILEEVFDDIASAMLAGKPAPLPVGEGWVDWSHVRAVWLSDEGETGDGWTYITKSDGSLPPIGRRIQWQEQSRDGVWHLVWGASVMSDDVLDGVRNEGLDPYVGDRWRFVDGE